MNPESRSNAYLKLHTAILLAGGTGLFGRLIGIGLIFGLDARYRLGIVIGVLSSFVYIVTRQFVSDSKY